MKELEAIFKERYPMCQAFRIQPNYNVIYDAKANFAFVLSDNELTNRDINKSLYWYQKASDLNNSTAKERLAKMYLSGDGVDVNKEKAFILMKEAASLGSAPAQVNIGIMFDEGIGCVKDRNAALYWWNVALKNPKSSQEDKEKVRQFLSE